VIPSRTILHPTDFTAHSELAFGLARSLARTCASRLLVLHALPGMRVNAEPHYREQLATMLRRHQQEIGQVEVEQRLEEGDPAAGILRVAQECHCDRIVMGTHGRTGLSRLLMGSVADQIVHNAPCPVLMVKAGAGALAPAEVRRRNPGHQTPSVRPIRVILHPTDFSAPSDEAFRVACMLAEDCAARLIVLHIAQQAVPGVPGMMATDPALLEDYQGAIAVTLRRFQQAAPRVRVECRVEEGTADAGIINAVRATESDLIVMGRHGRTGPGRILKGSVAEEILRAAPCSVMTVTTLSIPPHSKA
jgi:nucleotide-binding universal stress UspA family protein